MSAFEAATALGLDVVVPVFFPVIINKFLAGLDIFSGHNENTASSYFWFAVGAAGVVNVASGVFASGAVQGDAGIDLKQIFAPTGIFFRLTDGPAGVFDDASAFGDSGGGK